MVQTLTFGAIHYKNEHIVDVWVCGWGWTGNFQKKAFATFGIGSGFDVFLRTAPSEQPLVQVTSGTRPQCQFWEPKNHCVAGHWPKHAQVCQWPRQLLSRSTPPHSVEPPCLSCPHHAFGMLGGFNKWDQLFTCPRFSSTAGGWRHR